MPNSNELKNMRMLENNEGVHILRAIDEDGETAIAAIFKESPVSSESVFFQHVYVRPEYRGKNMIQSFPLFVEQYFSERGVKQLWVRCCGDEPKMETLYDYLVKEAFVPLIVQGRIVRYRLENWLNSAFMKKIDLMEKYLENVLVIDDWQDERLQEFLKSGFDMSKSCFDPQFCRFYQIGGRIQAALCAKRVDDELLFFYDLFFTDKCPKQVAFISMLASFIKEARDSMPEGSVLVAQSNLSAIQQGLKAQFGEPETEYISHEYFYQFGRRDYDATPEEMSGWRFERVDEETAREAHYLPQDLPLYHGIDDDVVACLNDPASMIPGILGRARRHMEKDEDIRAWRMELNAWQEQLGRESFGMDKALPFGAFLETKEIAIKAPDLDFEQDEFDDDDIEPVPIDEIAFSRLNKDLEEFSAILPLQLRNRCANGELIVIIGTDSIGNVLCYSAFSEQIVPAKTCYLEYVYVSPRYRRKGLGTKLLNFAKDIFANAKIRGITAKQATSARIAEKNHSFLKSVGFQPVSMASTMTAYYLQSLYDTAFMKMTEEQMKKLPPMETISDRNDIRLKQLAYDSRKQGFMFDRRSFDRRFTRFYIKDGVIRAVLAMEQLSENVLVYKDMWFAEGYDSPVMRVALLGAILDAAKRRMRDDSVLVLQFDQAWRQEKVQAMWGSGEVKLHLYEYVLPLKPADEAVK